MADNPDSVNLTVDHPLPVVGGHLRVRRFNYKVVHLALVDPSWFVATKWVGPPYWAMHAPAVTVCGTVLRPDHRGLVAMRGAIHERCRHCARLAFQAGGADPWASDEWSMDHAP